MLENDERLFDEFKRVDIICKDMFLSQHGVSKYISEMEQTPSYYRSKVKSWDEDYQKLKRVRWLRNRIVHEMSTTDCNADDIEWLENFHARILRQQDPLAVLAKMGQLRSKNIRTSTSEQSCVPSTRIEAGTRQRTHGKFIAVSLGAVVVVLAVAFIFFVLK